MTKVYRQRKIDMVLWRTIPEDKELKVNEMIYDKENERMLYVRSLSDDLGCCWIIYSEVNDKGKPKAKKFIMNSKYFNVDFLRQLRALLKNMGYYWTDSMFFE